MKAPETAPLPRVGSASATVGDTIYFFSGRGGPEMAPVNEDGAVWALSTKSGQWTLLRPASSTYPEARSYHTTASDGKDIIYVHAGCQDLVLFCAKGTGIKPIVKIYINKKKP